MFSLSISFDIGLSLSVGRVTGNALKARGSARNPEQEANCGRRTCSKSRVITGIQCDACEERTINKIS